MLRSLTILLSFPIICFAGQYNEANKEQIDYIKKTNSEMIEKANKLSESDEFVENINKQFKDALEIKGPTKGVGINLKKDIIKHSPKLIEQIDIAEDKNQVSHHDNNLIVFISFSMPKPLIKALIEEANSIGASVVLNGLIDESFDKTILAIKDMAGKNIDGGIMIDPTMFDLFEVVSAPSFVITMDTLKRCVSEKCKAPKYVKAKGSATIKYFLETVARTGDDNAKVETKKWLAKYE